MVSIKFSRAESPRANGVRTFQSARVAWTGGLESPPSVKAAPPLVIVAALLRCAPRAESPLSNHFGRAVFPLWGAYTPKPPQGLAAVTGFTKRRRIGLTQHPARDVSFGRKQGHTNLGIPLGMPLSDASLTGCEHGGGWRFLPRDASRWDAKMDMFCQSNFGTSNVGLHPTLLTTPFQG